MTDYEKLKALNEREKMVDKIFARISILAVIFLIIMAIGFTWTLSIICFKLAVTDLILYFLFLFIIKAHWWDIAQKRKDIPPF